MLRDCVNSDPLAVMTRFISCNWNKIAGYKTITLKVIEKLLSHLKHTCATFMFYANIRNKLWVSFTNISIFAVRTSWAMEQQYIISKFYYCNKKVSNVTVHPKLIFRRTLDQRFGVKQPARMNIKIIRYKFRQCYFSKGLCSIHPEAYQHS